MHHIIKPSWIINSPYDIQPEELLARGFKACLVDLDNTMLAWYEEDYSPELLEWVTTMEDAGLQVGLISNNTTSRVARVAEPLGLPYQANALKPLTKGFKRLVEDFDLDPSQVVVIGDQVMTDVIGANRLRMHSILVKPMAETDIIYSIINRQLEKVALRLVGIDRSKDWGNQLGRRI